MPLCNLAYSKLYLYREFSIKNQELWFTEAWDISIQSGGRFCGLFYHECGLPNTALILKRC